MLRLVVKDLRHSDAAEQSLEASIGVCSVVFSRIHPLYILFHGAVSDSRPTVSSPQSLTFLGGKESGEKPIGRERLRGGKTNRLIHRPLFSDASLRHFFLFIIDSFEVSYSCRDVGGQICTMIINQPIV